MTVSDLLAADRLTDAIAKQREIVEASVCDQTAKLHLFELHVVAGKFLDAHALLKEFEQQVPEFRDYAKSLRLLLKAERRRQHGQKPALLAEPPLHLSCRWHAVKAARNGLELKALKWLDRADSRVPAVRGHVNGREFEGLRDADDRTASQFEFLSGGRFYWVPFEQIRKLTLGPVDGVLDTVLRPAELQLMKTNETIRGHLPFVYAGTAFSGRDETFTLGRDSDYADVAGLVCGIGERVMTFGEEELPLSEIRQLEIRR